jgi:diguanylate cyclase (GGDEF)-like protein
MYKPCILIIDDDPALRKTLADILRAKRYKILSTGSGVEGLAFLGRHSVNLVLIDLGLPDMPGLEVLDKVKAERPFVEAIVLTGNATLDSAIEATNRGAFSYLVKPCQIEPLLLQIRRAIEKQQTLETITRDRLELQKANTELRALYKVSQAIGRTIDLEGLLSEVLHAMVETEVFDFKIKGAIFLAEEGKMRLASYISLTETELEPCREIRPGECLCGQAFATGEIVISTNSHTDGRHRKCIPAIHPHGHIIVPLKSASGTVGLLNLYIEPETEISDEMLKLLSSIASQMGVAINNARLYEETKTFSLQDSLTGLANRRFMEIQLDKSLEMAKRYQEALSVIMLDIDFFKDYNDAHGHLEGDKLLIRLAEILRREVRKADYVFRYGGEEFLIILPETDPGMARDAAERLRKAVEDDGEGVTISLGIASLGVSLGEKRQLLDAADNALYRAKQNGRNRVEAA